MWHFSLSPFTLPIHLQIVWYDRSHQIRHFKPALS